MTENLEIYEVKQNIIFANGFNEWVKLGIFHDKHLAIEYAEKIIRKSLIKKEDIAIMLTTYTTVEW